MKYIGLDFSATIENLPRVQRMVREKYAEDRGNCILFGKITGFFFVYSPTEDILLDVDGNEVENGRRQGKFWPQTVSLQSRLL